MRITIQIISRPIQQVEAQQMWQVYQQYYDIDESFFMQRLTQHDSIALFKVKGKIVGFTGVLRETLTLPFHIKLTTIGLGMTVIDEPWRKKCLIQRTVVRLTLREFARHPFRSVYVWSVALSIRPYLVFAKGLKTYYPKPEVEMPLTYQFIAEQLCQRHYTEWDLDRQLVYFFGLTLKQPSQASSNGKTTDKRIQYYEDTVSQARTLADREAVGLFTIAPANWENILFWGTKMALASLHQLRKRFVFTPNRQKPAGAVKDHTPQEVWTEAVSSSHG